MRRMTVAAGVVGALLLGTSAASAQSREQLHLMAELRMLQQDQQQLRQMLLALGDALKAVGGRLDEQAATTRKGLADQRLLVEGMTDNVRILRERADDTNVRLGSITQELEALRQSMGALSQQVASGTPPPADLPTDPSVSGTTAPGPTAPAAPPPPNMSPQRAYDSAYSDYAAGRYDLAIEGFETFLRYFPRHMNADNAQVNIGNALYNDGRFTEAATAYQRAITDYPGADTIPQAHYKLGLTYNELKQPDLARRSFEAVIKEHPSSVEAQLARQALDRQDRQAKP